MFGIQRNKKILFIFYYLFLVSKNWSILGIFHKGERYLPIFFTRSPHVTLQYTSNGRGGEKVSFNPHLYIYTAKNNVRDGRYRMYPKGFSRPKHPTHTSSKKRFLRYTHRHTPNFRRRQQRRQCRRGTTISTTLAIKQCKIFETKVRRYTPTFRLFISEDHFHLAGHDFTPFQNNILRKKIVIQATT